MSTFLQVVELLISNDEAKSEYSANPSGFLDQHGLSNLDSADIADAMQHSVDTLPMPVALRLDPESGLDSAASLDLEAEGLSLDRPGIDEFDELPDSTDLEDALASDVSFDADDAASGAEAVDGFDAADEGTETNELAEAVPQSEIEDILDDLDSEPGSAERDVEELTSDTMPAGVLDDVDPFDIASNEPFTESVEEVLGLDTDDLSTHTDDDTDLDHLDEDVPDGFDLLD